MLLLGLMNLLFLIVFGLLFVLLFCFLTLGNYSFFVDNLGFVFLNFTNAFGFKIIFFLIYNLLLLDFLVNFEIYWNIILNNQVFLFNLWLFSLPFVWIISNLYFIYCLSIFIIYLAIALSFICYTFRFILSD